MTMLVMGAVLALLGFVVYFGAERTMLASVDHKLKHDADGMAEPRGGPPHGPPRPPPDGFLGLLGNSPPHPRSSAQGLKPVILRVGPGGNLDLGHDKPYDANAVEQAMGRWSGYSDVTIDDSPVRLYTRPQFDQGRIAGVVQIPYDVGDILGSLRTLRTVLLVIVIPLGVLLSGVAGLFLVGRLIRPLREMREKAEAVSAHNLSDRLPETGEDEFAALATTLNAMLGRLELAFEQEQETLRQLEEAIAQQRRFTADASHELKTPLAVIKANTGLVLNMDASKADYREAVQQIDEAAGRMNKLVGDLLLLARADAGHLARRFERCGLNEILTEAVQQVPGTDERVTSTMPPDDVVIEGSPDDLARVFVNLIDNAMRHSPESAPVSVEVARRGEFASVSVKDAGPGIPPEHLEHLFERFYRIDKSRASETGGTGLGLAICKGVVRAHGGQISVISKVGRGTTFTVLLPLAA